MTNAQALQAVTEINYQIDSLSLEKALIDQGLDKDSEYSIANKKPIDLAWCAMIWTLVGGADVQEDQVKISLANRNSLLELRAQILNSYGLPTGKLIPRINVSHAW